MDPTQDPHYLLQPFALAAHQHGLQLPGVTHVTLAVETPDQVSSSYYQCIYDFRDTVYRRALLPREQARVRCEGPFEPNTGWCGGCSSCRGLDAVPAGGAWGPAGPATAAAMQVDVAGEAARVPGVGGPAARAAAAEAAGAPGAGQQGGMGSGVQAGAAAAAAGAAGAAAASASGCSRGGRSGTVEQEQEQEAGHRGRSNAHRAAVEVTMEEAEAEWRRKAARRLSDRAPEAFRATLRWLAPSGRFWQHLARLFPNLQSLDLAGEMWLPPHSGIETNTPALQARWAALLSALRPHRLPRLRSLAGPAHLLLHPGLAELKGLQHLTIHTEGHLQCPLPACVCQLLCLHTLTIEEVPRLKREFDLEYRATAGLPLHKLLPSLPAPLHLLRLRNARLRLFPRRPYTEPWNVDLQLRPQLHLRVRGNDTWGYTDAECVNHLIRVVSATMGSWPGYKQEQQQQQLQQQGTGGGGSGSSSGNEGPVAAAAAGGGGGDAASPAIRPVARCLGSVGPDERTSLAGLAGVEVDAIQLVAVCLWPLSSRYGTLPLQLMEVSWINN